MIIIVTMTVFTLINLLDILFICTYYQPISLNHLHLQFNNLKSYILLRTSYTNTGIYINFSPIKVGNSVNSTLFLAYKSVSVQTT